MLLDTDPKIKTINPVRLIKVLYPLIIVETETGDYVKVNLRLEQLADPLFWETAHHIAKSQLWVPLSKRFHQLLANDWLIPAD
ncbi:hypothetical protein [Lactiplantibacillus songbeiensis]|uniref:DUF2442 domain-containing protein n=1 Tax=Lactiplantibacillus songbeiensis TaxID=2559920 RepID=A0ABW4C3L9_9LACO|nr:hypothetical protein [Lactiplantibacillus songbeiensis]